VPPGTKRRETTITLFATNAPAFSIWQRCNKPVQVGFGGSIPVGVETTEIEAVCRVCDVALTPALLSRIRHLDSAYRSAVIDDLNKKASTKK
jgi:hypothetical protein